MGLGTLLCFLQSSGQGTHSHLRGTLSEEGRQGLGTTHGMASEPALQEGGEDRHTSPFLKQWTGRPEPPTFLCLGRTVGGHEPANSHAFSSHACLSLGTWLCGPRQFSSMAGNKKKIPPQFWAYLQPMKGENMPSNFMRLPPCLQLPTHFTGSTCLFFHWDLPRKHTQAGQTDSSPTTTTHTHYTPTYRHF